MKSILILFFCFFGIVTQSYAQADFVTHIFTYKGDSVECCRPTEEFLAKLNKKYEGLCYYYKGCLMYLDEYQRIISEGKPLWVSNLPKPTTNKITDMISLHRRKLNFWNKAYKIAHQIDTVRLEKEYQFYLRMDAYNDSVRRAKDILRQQRKIESDMRRDSIREAARKEAEAARNQPSIPSSMSDEEKMEWRIQQGARSSGNNRFAALYGGYTMHVTEPGMQGFLQARMNMTPVESGSGLDKDGNMFLKYVTRSGIPAKYVTLKYICDKEGKIKTLSLWGDYSLMAEIFVSYWPTTIRANEFNKNAVSLECLFMSDKITFTYKGGKYAYITVRSNIRSSSTKK